MHQNVEGLDWMYLVICRRIKLNVIFLWGATSYRFECLILKFKNLSVKSFFFLNFELNFKCYDTLNWKKSKRELRWCQLFAVVARKLQNYHLNCPKELCRLLCLSLYRCLHSLWPCIALWVVWTSWGGRRARLCKKGIALEYWITSTHYNIICQRMASLSLLYNLLRLKSTHIWVDYLSSECH